MVKIVHFSDWHSSFGNLPEADVYVCTGDMLDNYPIVEHHWSASGWSHATTFERTIDHAKEERAQIDWVKRKVLSRKDTLRRFFGSHDAPVVVVRGNHDFIDLAQLWGGEVFEISRDPTRTVEYCGLKFGGFRGINWMAGEWSDEEHNKTLEDRARRLPYDLDVLVTHGPPKGFLGGDFGMQSIINYMNRCEYQLDENDEPLGDVSMPRLFCFGHSHDNAGIHEMKNGTIFSNAACDKRVIEL